MSEDKSQDAFDRHLTRLNPFWLHMPYDEDYVQRREDMKRRIGVHNMPCLVIFSYPDCMLLTDKGVGDVSIGQGRLAVENWRQTYSTRIVDRKYQSERRLAEKLIRRHCSILLKDGEAEYLAKVIEGEEEPEVTWNCVEHVR